MKHLLTSVLLLAITLSTQAQLGLKLGGSASQFRAGYEVDNKLKTSVTSGLFVGIPLSHGVTLQPEMMYIRKGSLINKDNAPATDRFRMNLDYVEMPIVLRLGAGQFKFEAGGYAGYLAHMNIAKFNYGTFKNFDENDFQRYDFGAVGGIAYKWDWVTFSARYEHGLKTVGYRGQPLGWYDANKAFRNQNFSFVIEVPFN